MIPDDYRHRLAIELASRLAEVVPPSIAVRADGVEVHISSSLSASETWLECAATSESRTDPRAVAAGSARIVLSGVQDFVALETTDPWPGEVRMPMPFAYGDATQLHLGFGEVESPVLLLRPLPWNALDPSALMGSDA